MLLINDLSRRAARHRAAIDAAVRRVIDSGWFVLGPEVRAFEQAFAAYLAAPHCIGVANGTDALMLALLGAGVSPGQSVATVANAGMYATTAILAVGAKPMFMDVDEGTRLAGLTQVTRALAAGARAVVVTHLYGRAAPDIAEIAAACRAQGMALIEDCAQAHGARVNGRRVGTFGDFSAFSFYPTKNLGALGDGGAVVTGNDAMADRVRKLRQYGWTSKYTVGLTGGRNSRLDELQAAILSAVLPHLDADNARRRAIARRYGDGIRAPVALPQPGGDDDVAHLYVIRTRNRDGLRRHLEQRGVASDVHYPVPDHRQPVFGKDYAAVSLPVTELLTGEVLTLPCYPEMTDDDVGRVIEAVNGWAT